MNHTSSHPRHLQPGVRPLAGRRRGGFTLLEVMMALGIFAIGFVAIAAIFPVAIVMQRDACDDAISQQVGAIAKAMLQGRAFRARASQAGGLDMALPRKGDDALGVQPVMQLPDLFSTASPTPPRWSIRDRSFGPGEQLQDPSTINPYQRRYFWVPLVRRTLPAPTDQTGWEVFVFVLRSDAGRTYLAASDASTSPKCLPGWNLTFMDDIGAAWNGKADSSVPGTPKPPINPKENTGIPHVVSVPVNIGASGGTNNRFLFNNHLPTFTTPDPKDPNQVLIGDQILDDCGDIYTVIDADYQGVTVAGAIFAHPQTGSPPSRIYYGMPANGTNRSPTARILKLTDVVEP